MKKLIPGLFLILALLLLTFCSNAQDNFDLKLNALTDSIASKINEVGKQKIAVWDFTDIDGNPTNLGKYLSEQVSVILAIDAQSFEVVDRSHLKTILREHNLNSEGFIDAATAKELGKMQAADAIVTGKITIFTDRVVLTIKVLDTETALILAATKGDLPISNDIASFLGVPDMANDGSSNRGFNRPLNSNEQYNNPETVNNECAKKNTGDYCFTNSTTIKISVSISSNGFSKGSATLNPGEQTCFYNLPVGTYTYFADGQGSVTYSSGESFSAPTQVITKGQVLVEECKSKSYVVK